MIRESWRAFDAAWFARHQRTLLWLLHAPILGRCVRWALCLRPGDLGHRGPITALLPHAVVVGAGRQRRAEFRTHPKFAKRIYHIWRPVWWLAHAWDWAIADRLAPAWSCGFSTLTAYPDADPETTTVDGWVARDSQEEAWSTIRAGAGNAVLADATDERIIAIRSFSTTDNWNEIIRSIFLFDTSSLTVNASISAVVLSIHGTSSTADALSITPNVDIYTAAPASNTALASSDFSTLGSVSQTGSPIAYASWNTAGYNAFTFNSTGRGNVSKTSVSKFGARNANYDVANVAPTWSSLQRSRIDGYFADRTGTSQDPKLVVTYTVIPDGIYLQADNLDGGSDWVDLLDDTLARETFTFRRGMAGGGPLDRVATTGTCTFSLKNGPTTDNPSRPNGYYAFNSVNCREGWAFGTPIRVIYVLSGTTYELWTGTVKAANPSAGQYKDSRVDVMAVDCMNALAETDVREVSPQVNQTENTIIQAIIDALPTSAQPSALDYDASLDTYPYALDDASSGTPAIALLTNVAQSALAYIYPLGDGTLKVENRQARPAASSAFDFDESYLHDCIVPSDTSTLYNRVRLRTHPRRVDAAATTVLCGITTAEYVAAGETRIFWLDYVSPDNDLKLIGGTAPVTTLVSGTDYAGRANADGSGADLSANLTCTVNAFAAAAKFTVENTGGTGAYLVNGSGTPLLQLRGKGIYDEAPIEYEASSTQDYGDRLLSFDLPYQDDGSVAQDLATFMEAQYRSLNNQVLSIAYHASVSTTLLEQAVTREIGDVISVTETMTGVDDVDAVIQAIEWTVTPSAFIAVRYTLAPRVTSSSLILDDAVYGVLDDPVAALGWL